MNSPRNYYNQKVIPFCLGARRRRRVIPLLQKITGKKILDVGCASGYIGAVLCQQGNYVVGIDITRKDVAQAKKVLDRALVFDAENDKLSRLGKNYDLIIMAEVLEHFFDPEKTLKRFLPLLKPKGQILITTPNFVHIYNRIKIALGMFEYREETVINKSHVHFFTYETFKKAAKCLGLKVVQENHVILPEFLSPVLKFWPGLFAAQIVMLYEK